MNKNTPEVPTSWLLGPQSCMCHIFGCCPFSTQQFIRSWSFFPNTLALLDRWRKPMNGSALVCLSAVKAVEELCSDTADGIAGHCSSYPSARCVVLANGNLFCWCRSSCSIVFLVTTEILTKRHQVNYLLLHPSLIMPFFLMHTCGWVCGCLHLCSKARCVAMLS